MCGRASGHTELLKARSGLPAHSGALALVFLVRWLVRGNVPAEGGDASGSGVAGSLPADPERRCVAGTAPASAPADLRLGWETSHSEVTRVSWSRMPCKCNFPLPGMWAAPALPPSPSRGLRIPSSQSVSHLSSLASNASSEDTSRSRVLWLWTAVTAGG